MIDRTDTHQELMLRLTTRLVHLCIERRHPAAADPATLIAKTYAALQTAGAEVGPKLTRRPPVRKTRRPPNAK